MKCSIKIIFTLVVFFLVGCVGHKPLTEKERTFSRVVDVPGYTKEQIFHNSKIWVAENFKSAKAVLEYENPETGTIIGNGVIPYPCVGFECIAKAHWKVPFTMRIDIKQQKFRLAFSNIHISWPASYDRTFGAKPAYNGPINTQSDIDAIKPKLLAFGDQLLASFDKEKNKSNW